MANPVVQNTRPSTPIGPRISFGNNSMFIMASDRPVPYKIKKKKLTVMSIKQKQIENR